MKTAHGSGQKYDLRQMSDLIALAQATTQGRGKAGGLPDIHHVEVASPAGAVTVPMARPQSRGSRRHPHRHGSRPRLGVDGSAASIDSSDAVGSPSSVASSSSEHQARIIDGLRRQLMEAQSVVADYDRVVKENEVLKSNQRRLESKYRDLKAKYTQLTAPDGIKAELQAQIKALRQKNADLARELSTLQAAEQARARAADIRASNARSGAAGASDHTTTAVLHTLTQHVEAARHARDGNATHGRRR